MKTIGYLVNQYPKISHVFIHREIAALEKCGLRIERFSLRLCKDKLVDPADLAELTKTRIVLETGLHRIALACISAFIARPHRFLRSLALAIRLGLRSDRGMVAHLAYLAEACVLLRWTAELRIDHVHAHFATNAAAAAMLCRMLGGPSYSFTAHGPDDFDRAAMLGLDEKVARATFVMTVSSYGRSQLYRWCDPRQWPKIHVSHPGVDDFFVGATGVPIPSEPRLVCVGRLAEQKGHLVLLQAVRGLMADGKRCELVLVGDGSLCRQIEAAIAQLQLQDHVILAGALSREGVLAQMQSARALVLSSFAENLPTVILEAFALCRPVIATFVGGIPEVVEPGVNGWLAPAGSVEALQAAMRQALDASPDTLEQMGRNGAARVRDLFHSDRAASELLRLFRAGGEN